MKDWCQMTMRSKWHPAFLPPMNARMVMLRFDDDGQRDCMGFYWTPDRSWYKSVESQRKQLAVHPVKWSEIAK